MTMEALAPWPHLQVSRRYSQYHMRTYSASHRVNDSGHPLDGRLGGYCRGLVPRATSYGPQICIWMVPFSGKQLGNHTPHTGYGPSHSWLMRRAPQPKKGLHSGANQTDLPPPHDDRGWAGSSHLSNHCGPPHDPACYNLPWQSCPGALQYRAGALNQALGRLRCLKAWHNKM
jgi:hypothetical protein